MELTLWLAFIAGIVSFLSPCVLPLVPAYVGYMGGRVTNSVATSVRTGATNSRSSGNQSTSRTRFATALHGLFFVAGFTFVFVSIGLLSTAFIQQVGGANINRVTEAIGRIGGVVIIFFGLHFMGAVPRFFNWLRTREGLLDNVVISVVVALTGGAVIVWSFTGQLDLWHAALWDETPGLAVVTTALLALFWGWLLRGGAFTRTGAFWNGTINRIEIALYSDTRRNMSASGRQGYAGSALMGVVFSAGWTPCIGPVYGAVLTLAASGGDVSRAGTLLAAYSVGLGVPFLLTALMLDSAQGVLRRLQRRMRMIELVSGTFLIVIGFTVASGELQSLSERLAGDFADFSIELEESVLAFVTGEDDPAIALNESNNESNSASDEDEPSTTGDREARAPVNPDELEVGLEIGNLAPDFETVLDTGERIALSELRGQVVLLNFWATWCGPCRVEMPEFQDQYERHADDGFTILAVNNGESRETVQAYRAELGLTFPLALDQDADIQEQYGLFSYPSTLLLDQNGVIVARHFGALTSAQIDEIVSELLDLRNRVLRVM